MASTRDPHTVLAEFVHARSGDAVVLASDADDAVRKVVDAAPGQSVLLDLTAGLGDRRTGDHAGDRLVAAQVDLTTTLAALDRELSVRPAALLIVPGVAPSTGEVLPLSKLAAVAHRHGARLLVDASELAARRVINMTSHGIDYVVFTGRQLAGHGPAVVVGRPDWLRDVIGVEADPSALDGLAQGCDEVAGLGFEWIGLHEQALSDTLDEALQRLPGTRRLRLWADVADRVGIASVAVAGREAPFALRWGFETGRYDVAQQLDSLADVVFEQEKS